MSVAPTSSYLTISRCTIRGCNAGEERSSETPPQGYGGALSIGTFNVRCASQ